MAKAETGRSCFVVSPIGDDGSEVRRRSDQVFNYLIAPIVSSLGFTPTRAEKITRPGIITHDVIKAVAEADLVVADLTDHNPNVFYELALRHGLQRPLVQLIDATQRLPFDVAGMRTIFFDIHDLDSVEAAKNDLALAISDMEDDPRPLDTPVSVARDMARLWESEDPGSKDMAEILNALAAMRSELTQRLDRVEQRASPGALTRYLRDQPFEADLRTVTQPTAYGGGKPMTVSEFNKWLADSKHTTAPDPNLGKPRKARKKDANLPDEGSAESGDG